MYINITINVDQTTNFLTVKFVKQQKCICVILSSEMCLGILDILFLTLKQKCRHSSRRNAEKKLFRTYTTNNPGIKEQGKKEKEITKKR